MKKGLKTLRLFVLLALFATLFASLLSCEECSHSWQAATCTEKEVCTLCGEVRGEPLGHSFGEWNETVPVSCTEGGKRQ